jgi:putative membrane protein
MSAGVEIEVGEQMPSPVVPPHDPRFALANERTLLSWVRVALALIAAGTTAGTVIDIKPAWLHAAVAFVPISLGLTSALLGLARWRRVDDAIRRGVELPPDRELGLVAFAVAFIAVIAGTAAMIGVFDR